MPAEKAHSRITGFCRAPGLTRQDIADVLAVLPSGLASHMPIVALGGKHAAHPDKLILASESLLHLSGAKNLAGLFRFLSGGEGGCSQRLADVAANLATRELRRMKIDIRVAAQDVRQLRCKRRIVAFQHIPFSANRAADAGCERRKYRIVRAGHVLSAADLAAGVRPGARRH